MLDAPGNKGVAHDLYGTAGRHERAPVTGTPFTHDHNGVGIDLRCVA